MLDVTDDKYAVIQVWQERNLLIWVHSILKGIFVWFWVKFET